VTRVSSLAFNAILHISLEHASEFVILDTVKVDLAPVDIERILEELAYPHGGKYLLEGPHGYVHAVHQLWITVLPIVFRVWSKQLGLHYVNHLDPAGNLS
jgi:hypothetical protein